MPMWAVVTNCNFFFVFTTWVWTGIKATLIGQALEDIIIDGDQKKRLLSAYQFQVSSLYSLYLPFCLFFVIWSGKKGRGSYYSLERWDSSSDGVIDSWAEPKQHIKHSKFNWCSVSMAICSWFLLLINECNLFW